MGDTQVVIDGVSLDATGGANPATTSSEVDVSNEPAATLQIDGDSNTSDIDIVMEAKVRDVDSDSWSEHDASISNDDVTTTANNSKTYTYDVENLVKVRYVVTNNAASSTTVTGINSVEQ